MMEIDWAHYRSDKHFDELIGIDSIPRPASKALCDYLANLAPSELSAHKSAAEAAIQTMGITFTVYSEGNAIDRAWPFDIVPRIIPAKEWRRTETGLKQRVKALNLLIDDIYHDQRAFKDGILPPELLANSANFRPQCVGIDPPHHIWAHICGSDLVRDKSGTIYVLEDNLRVPSGVSYMLENRNVTKRVLPEFFANSRILPVDDYASQLYDMLASMSPRPQDEPHIVVLSPGIYNSAYYEHAYLAQQMGIELVLGEDLIVDDNDVVYMRTVVGLTRVDVIYRRIDDLFLDPEVFHPDSMLGVPGLMRAWRTGNVALANAPGAGVADDKVMYAFVPDLIRYYLDEEPILPNVPSYLCMFDDQRDYVLNHLDELVVKPANESGGYGLLIGPHATPEERSRFAELIKADPRNYMAQPMLNLSTSPTLCGDAGIQPRHIDLRPFILSGGDSTYVTTGGLTRVALVEGSLVVNSSQEGGQQGYLDYRHRGGGVMDMLSRVAENLYWMSRYIERAENTARMVSVDVHLQLDFPEARPKGWANLLDITSSSDQFEARYNDFNEQNVMAFLCADKEYSGSLISSLAAARENLRTTRDIIPQEIWEEINALYMKVSARVAGGLVPSNREQFLKEIIRGCQTITGILEGSLSRTQASTFIRIGRHLERADMTTRIIDVRSGSLLPRDPSQLTPFENLEWMSVLKSLTGYQMYRQQIRVRVRAADVLEFLAKDRHFPRSICYCLNTLSEELRHLPHHDRPLASATLIQAEVAETDFRLLAKSPDDLSNTMDQFQVDFNALHESICSNFFARKGIEQSLENQTQTAPNDMLDED